MKPGDDIQHKRYGLCSIVDITGGVGSLFGVIVQPKTPEGKALLATDCGVPDIPLMEGSIRRLSKPVKRVVGIDLTGSEKRASGFALLSGNEVEFTSRIRTDEVLITESVNIKPDLVSIDSPLSLPEDPTKIYRDCELTLKRRGIGVYWCFLPSMKALTLRGIALADKLRKKGLTVIESYPGAAQDILGIPRKSKGTHVLAEALAEYGIKGDLDVSHDELDAITSAIVGQL